MSYDNLTIAAITVVAVIIIVVILLGRSKNQADLRLRKLVRNLSLMQSSEEATAMVMESSS